MNGRKISKLLAFDTNQFDFGRNIVFATFDQMSRVDDKISLIESNDNLVMY